MISLIVHLKKPLNEISVLVCDRQVVNPSILHVAIAHSELRIANRAYYAALLTFMIK